MTDAWPLTCPVCDDDLCAASGTPGTLACAAGHSFDVAREGYVNLLPPRRRAGAVTGDTADMLRARRRFLEAGYYDPLCALLGDAVTETLPAQAGNAETTAPRASIVEMGCGTGYYIGSVATHYGRALRPVISFVGVDISRAAAKLAARRYPDVRFAVADVHRRIPVRTSAVNVLLDVFAPRNPAEFARVLAPGGSAIIVIPAASHLESLRRRLGLIGIQTDKEARVLDQVRDHFRLVGRHTLTFPLELPRTAMTDLVLMGPNYWHAAPGSGPDDGAVVITEASFIVLRLERTGTVPRQER